MSLQTRLMTAVIGFVSLILVIVAIITSATLGSTLEQQLDDKVKGYAVTIRDQVVERVAPSDATVENILYRIDPVPGLLLSVGSPVAGATGVAFHDNRAELSNRSTTLTSEQLRQLYGTVALGTQGTITFDGLGSYRVFATTASNGVVVVTGLPRDEIQNQLTQLLTVIVLA
ncbi:MAG: two-component sensor histidine kinase, partial [Microbacterium sp.]|nr:two-component sensor histidine kinase [Microbacterium sp.]